MYYLITNNSDAINKSRLLTFTHIYTTSEELGRNLILVFRRYLFKLEFVLKLNSHALRSKRGPLHVKTQVGML